MSAGYTVGQVAHLAGVTVRTLHHYDEIGLLSPSERSRSGYRHYGQRDLERLRQILFYRELGFALEEIASILADTRADAAAHLRRQHRLLRERVARMQDMIMAIEKELEARQMGISLSPEEQFEIFGTDKVGGEWAEEAERRWGDTAAYRESQRRTAAYTRQDWIEIKAEADAGLRGFAEALGTGVEAGSPDVMDLAEAHRQHISRWFYDCDYAMHRGLAEMYVADKRFRAAYDNIAAGLAEYVHDAIIANAERAGA